MDIDRNALRALSSRGATTWETEYDHLSWIEGLCHESTKEAPAPGRYC